MAIPTVINNNFGAPITANGNYCTIQVPGYIPPAILGAAGSPAPQFSAFAYTIVAGSTATGTIVTFNAQGADGLWRALATPAPLTLANSTSYSATTYGLFGAIQLSVSALAGNGITYAQLTGSTAANGGGGGGGGGATGNYVSKTGDTMSGTLDLAGTSGAALLIVEDPETTGQTINNPKITLNPRPAVTGNGWPGILFSAVYGGTYSINLYQNGARLSTDASFYANSFVSNGGGLSLTDNSLTLIYGSFNVALSLNTTTADLMVTANTGPNAGKSVNLTSGKWV